jgi:hypothetical protein
MDRTLDVAQSSMTNLQWPSKQPDTEQIHIFNLSDEKVFENLPFFQPNTVSFKVYGSSTNL